MNIYVNGVLVLLDVVGRRVAVELNDHIVAKSQHAHVILQANDKVEVVHAIGGG